ncbi:RNA-directed DNA polymerase [Tanacetum coccineum]
MTKTMEQYMSKTRGNYGSGVARPKINDKTHFELKGQFPQGNYARTTLARSNMKHKQHFKRHESFDLFHIPEILDMKGFIPIKPVADRKITIQKMSNTLSKGFTKPPQKPDMNEKVYAAQVGCELCKGPHYTKDCPLKEEGKTLEEAYYTQFGAPYQPERTLIEHMARIYQPIMEILREAINESFDPLYVNYIELNDLDMPLEPRMNQDDFEPTPDFVNEPAYKSFKDTGDHEGKNLAGTLIDIPIFVGKFSIISGFSITDDIDITSGVVPGIPFCKKFVSCQNIMERFTHEDKCE